MQAIFSLLESIVLDASGELEILKEQGRSGLGMIRAGFEHRLGGAVQVTRPYDTLRAKGEDRRAQIVAAAQRLLTRNGWRSTTLAQIAQEVGMTTAGLLYHFPSKEQLLHAVLDARDVDDDARSDRAGDLAEEIRKTAYRIERSPELVGTFVVLLVENLMVDAPLHGRLLERWRTSVDIVAEAIRSQQCSGRYRADIDPAVRAVEIVAFINRIEMSWLLDRSTPLREVFAEYSRSLERDLVADAVK